MERGGEKGWREASLTVVFAVCQVKGAGWLLLHDCLGELLIILLPDTRLANVQSP